MRLAFVQAPATGSWPQWNRPRRGVALLEDHSRAHVVVAQASMMMNAPVAALAL